MALVQQTKQGGPYTKKEREKRRKNVYELHFQKCKSAVKIAEELNLNRNTVNVDIKFWYSQMANELEIKDLVLKAIKQIYNSELQKTRLFEDLEKTSNLDEKLRIEKLLFEIDSRLTQLIIKIIVSGKSLIPKTELIEISENKIKEFVRRLILEDDFPYESPYDEDIYSENEIKFELLRKTKCDMKYTENFFQRMLELGLQLCKETRINPSRFSEEYDNTFTYNIGKFAHLRNYMSIEEFVKISKKRDMNRKEIEKLEEEKFEQKSTMINKNNTVKVS